MGVSKLRLKSLLSRRAGLGWSLMLWQCLHHEVASMCQFQGLILNSLAASTSLFTKYSHMKSKLPGKRTTTHWRENVENPGEYMESESGLTAHSSHHCHLCPMWIESFWTLQTSSAASRIPSDSHWPQKQKNQSVEPNPNSWLRFWRKDYWVDPLILEWIIIRQYITKTYGYEQYCMVAESAAICLSLSHLTFEIWISNCTTMPGLRSLLPDSLECLVVKWQKCPQRCKWKYCSCPLEYVFKQFLLLLPLE